MPPTIRAFWRKWPSTAAAPPTSCASIWPSRPTSIPPPTTAPSPTTLAARWTVAARTSRAPSTARFTRCKPCATARIHTRKAPSTTKKIRRPAPSPPRGRCQQPRPAPGAVATARQLQGKELACHTVADTDAALESVHLFDAPTWVIVKHADPGGVATAPGLLEAYQRAGATDPDSAVGG